MDSPSIELLPGEAVDLGDTEAPSTKEVDPETRYSEGEVRIVTDQARYPLNAVPGLLDSDDYRRSLNSRAYVDESIFYVL